MIHTVGDIILAANLGRELHKLVLDYLRDYCTYANGANGIEYALHKVRYTTIHGISGTPEQPILLVSVCTRSEYVPFDTFVEEERPDGYEGYGRYGRYESSGYEDNSYSEIQLPMVLLLDTREVRISKLTKIKQDWISKQEEEARQKEIKYLQDRLAKLNT